MNYRAQVLDHGFVEYVEHMGTDLTPLVAARMSTETLTGVDEAKDDSLRDRLWRDQHTSPFEMPELVVTIQLPIFCLRQFDRHRTVDYTEAAVESVDETTRKFMSRNEFSGRYSVMPDLFYAPAPSRVLGKDPKNKQGSKGPLPLEIQESTVNRIYEMNRLAADNYKWMVENGVANEIARFVLPGTQYTKIMLKGSMLSWFKLANLRMRPDVQEETRLYMEKIWTLITMLWPKSAAVFMKHTFNVHRLSQDVVDRIAIQRTNLKQMIQKLIEVVPRVTEENRRLVVDAEEAMAAP